MKAQKSKLTLLLISIQLLVIFAASAGTQEYTKNLHQDYDADQNTLLIIQNKFGNVNINDWDKNQVSIDVTIKIDHKNEEKAKELLNYINVEFSKEGNTLKAITTIDEKFNNGFSWSDNKKEFSIDYEVKIPKKLQLNLENKYGNAFINEITGHSVITIKYGNLKANKIIRDNTRPLSEIYLAYSNGTIKECEWLKLTLKYSKLEIEKSKALIAVTKYSKLYVDNASSIVSESKYDTYKIGKVANFVTTAAYTDFKFVEIYKKLEVENRYGGITVEHMPGDFEKIDIDNEYGNVKIGLEAGTSYQLNGIAKYGDIEYPEGGRISRIKETTETTVNGIVGNNDKTASVVEITTKYGSVNLSYTKGEDDDNGDEDDE